MHIMEEIMICILQATLKIKIYINMHIYIRVLYTHFFTCTYQGDIIYYKYFTYVCIYIYITHI